MGLGWWLVGLIMFITIVGIPWGRACFVIGNYAFWPFGREMVSRKLVTGKDDLGTGALGQIGNIIWFILAGVWLAIGHAISAFACAITIVGIPLALAHLKLIPACLAPVGKTIVTTEEAERLGAAATAWR